MSRQRGNPHDRGRPDSLQVLLPYRPPLDWAGLLAFLGPRAIPGIEAATLESYRRTVAATDAGGPGRDRTAAAAAGVIQVVDDPDAHGLVLTIPAVLAAQQVAISRRVRALFDLDTEPQAVARALGGDALLGPLVQRRPGLRVPGCWDRFELMVRAILGQQVTVRGATTLAARLVQRHGTRLGDDHLSGETGEPTGDVVGGDVPAEKLGLWSFPKPASLAGEDLAGLGMPGSRGRTIRGLAAAVASGELDLEQAGNLESVVKRLCALPGIGPWTAHYVAMRAFRETDAFPAADLALLKALAGEGERPSPRQAMTRAETWRPWRAYATMHLWSLQGEPVENA